MKEKKADILKAFAYRQAIKEFTDQKISDEDFEFILETGRLSPSSFGWEPWHFVVVQNPEVREKLKAYSWGAQKQLPTASHFVLILGRTGKEMMAGSEYLNNHSIEVAKLPEDIAAMKLDFFDKFQKNDFDLTDERKVFDWASKQAYLPFGNMMTAAAQIGIDSCPIEGFNKEKVEDILVDAGILDADKFGVVAMVAFGYKKVDLEWPKTRREMNQVVTWVN